jgi:hypothetical protein
MPPVETLGIQLGWTMSEARARQPDIAFAEARDSLGIKRLLPNGELVDLSYLASIENQQRRYWFRAEPFGEQIYAILREDRLDPPRAPEQMRQTLGDRYGAPAAEMPSRACWGKCDGEARILKSAEGVSLVADFPPTENGQVEELRLLLWSGDVVRAAREAADLEVADRQAQEAANQENISNETLSDRASGL